MEWSREKRLKHERAELHFKQTMLPKSVVANEVLTWTWLCLVSDVSWQ